jgi:hypothetical protein
LWQLVEGLVAVPAVSIRVEAGASRGAFFPLGISDPDPPAREHSRIGDSNSIRGPMKLNFASVHK